MEIGQENKTLIKRAKIFKSKEGEFYPTFCKYGFCCTPKVKAHLTFKFLHGGFICRSSVDLLINEITILV